ncbi:MAG: glycosyltransferase family 4 protein [Nitrospirota bacterium]
MKLLVISAAFPPMKAGEADHAYRICTQLAQKGADVHVLTTKGSQLPKDASFVVHDHMRDWSWRDLLRLRSVVKSCAPDVILLIFIGWIYHEHPMITFAPTVCKRAVPGVRVVTLFEYFSSWVPGRCSIVTRIIRGGIARLAGGNTVNYEYGTLLRDSDAIVTLSGKHTKALASVDPTVEKKTWLIPPPPLLKIASGEASTIRRVTRSRIGIAPDDFLIAYFGYIYPPKGVETLLKAFQLVLEQAPQARLILIGGVVAQKYPDQPNYAEDMKALPAQLGISDKVTWIGAYATDSEEPSQYLYASDACAFAHYHGVYLNNSSFAAAAAHGLPIIATRPPWVEEPFVDGENLIFCAPKDPEDMASSLLRLMRDPILQERLRNGSFELARRWFSWDMTNTRLLEAFGVEGGAGLVTAERVSSGGLGESHP